MQLPEIEKWLFPPHHEVLLKFQNSGKSAEFGRSLTKYMSVQRIWDLSWLMGLFFCHKLANLHVQYSSEITVHVNVLRASQREVRWRESIKVTRFKNGLALELISMYELAYCSWFIVVTTAAAKGLTLSTRLGEDWNRVSILHSNWLLDFTIRSRTKDEQTQNYLKTNFSVIF